jgi:hypothetical protein
MERPAGAPETDFLALSEKKQQFRLVRRAGYGALGIVVLVLLYLAWVQGGGSSDPFFIPLPQLMFVMLFGALLLNLTSVAFGALEVHAASSGEQRYLIARHGYSTGLVTAVFAVFFFVIIAALGPVIDQQIDYSKDIELGLQAQDSTVTAPFNVTSDYTGSSYLAWIHIESTNGLPFNVTLFQHDDYSPNATQTAGKEIVHANNVTLFHLDFISRVVETDPDGNATTPTWGRLPKAPEAERYFVVLFRKDPAASFIVYRQDRQLDPGFVGSVYTLLLALVALNGIAAAYNYVLRQKWRAYGEKNY